MLRKLVLLSGNTPTLSQPRKSKPERPIAYQVNDFFETHISCIIFASGTKRNMILKGKIFFTTQQILNIHICYNQVCFIVFNYRIKFQLFVFQYINKIRLRLIHSYFIVFRIVFHSYFTKFILYLKN
jgi:hypothetical protein